MGRESAGCAPVVRGVIEHLAQLLLGEEGVGVEEGVAADLADEGLHRAHGRDGVVATLLLARTARGTALG